MRLTFFDRKSGIISLMRSSECYIYGAGDCALSVGNFLKELGVRIQAYVVDDEYYKIGMLFEGIEVISLSEYLCKLNQNASSFFVWAIARPSKLRTAILNTEIPEAWITYDAVHMWQDNEFAHKHKTEFDDTKILLADKLSRETLDAYLDIFDGKPEKDVECIVDDIYFNDLTKQVKGRDGCFVDCGAYIGNIAIQFASVYGKEKIYCFEPDVENYKKLKENVKDLNAIVINAGCWNKKTTLRLSGQGESSRIGNEGDIEVNVVSVDDVVKDDKVAFVKLDVEGSELQALKGMQKIIKRDMPILAISAYHRQEDLITLPQFVSGFETEDKHYQLFLRHHGFTTSELVLYAIPTQK